MESVDNINPQIWIFGSNIIIKGGILCIFQVDSVILQYKQLIMLPSIDIKMLHASDMT